MDFVVFGDDWGRHPSTTQHLVRHLCREDRVLWIESIGMRTPRLERRDLGRVAERLRVAARSRITRGPTVTVHDVGEAPRVVVRRAPILPFHTSPAAVALSRRAFARWLDETLRSLEMAAPVVIAANPVAARYVREVPRAGLVYLRLDDYAELPGVDAALARAAEAEVRSLADLVVAPAQSLLDGVPAARALHLPQGVDVAHFGAVDVAADKQRVLGFFGALAAWVDYQLVRDVAVAHPSWTLELRGPRLAPSPLLDGLPNVRVLPAVPYAELPRTIEHWSAAWLPFVRNELTRNVNPLKLREYLAAGIAAATTPLPAAADLAEVRVVESARDVGAFLAHVEAHDAPALRRARRAAMTSHSWAARAVTLQDAIRLRVARAEAA